MMFLTQTETLVKEYGPQLIDGSISDEAILALADLSNFKPASQRLEQNAPSDEAHSRLDACFDFIFHIVPKMQQRTLERVVLRLLEQELCMKKNKALCDDSLLKCMLVCLRKPNSSLYAIFYRASQMIRSTPGCHNVVARLDFSLNQLLGPKKLFENSMPFTQQGCLVEESLNIGGVMSSTEANVLSVREQSPNLHKNAELFNRVGYALEAYQEHIPINSRWFLFQWHGKTGIQRATALRDKLSRQLEEDGPNFKAELIEYLSDKSNGNTHPHSFRTYLLVNLHKFYKPGEPLTNETASKDFNRLLRELSLEQPDIDPQPVPRYLT